MDNQTGITCSSANLRNTPDLKLGVIEALNSQEHVEIIGDAGTMFKVQTTRWNPPIVGYVLKSSIIVPKVSPQIFSNIDTGNNVAIPSVPASLPLATFLTWFSSQGEPSWLPADYLASIQAGQKASVGAMIRQTIAGHQADWDAWVSEINQRGRQSTATMDEWLVILAGGRTMWSFRTERIFAQPSQSAAAPAWVSPSDVLLWTGHVQFNNQEPKYKLWYEVEFTKLDQAFKGWYKADLLQEFIMPTPDTDLTDPENSGKVFDLSHPLLRLPADPEIDAARKLGTGAQYINTIAATGRSKVNFNLCGEFSCAALGGSDVIPFLKSWIASYKNGSTILQNDSGTSIQDLESMLDVFKKTYEFFQAEESVIPLTPGYLRKVIDSGRMALVGTGITHDGQLKWNSHIRHWVVIEDIIMVSNSGWVRVYNPYPDKEEVYPYDVVFDATTGTVIGLLVAPTHP